MPCQSLSDPIWGRTVFKRSNNTISRNIPISIYSLSDRLAGEGHHQQIAQFAAAGAVDAVLGEAHHHRVAPLVAAAIVPTVVAGLRTRLHRSERQRRARMAVPRPVGPGKDVHQSGVVRLCAADSSNKQNI